MVSLPRRLLRMVIGLALPACTSPPGTGSPPEPPFPSFDAALLSAPDPTMGAIPIVTDPDPTGSLPPSTTTGTFDGGDPFDGAPSTAGSPDDGADATPEGACGRSPGPGDFLATEKEHIMASISRRFVLGTFAGALAVSAGLTSAHADQLDDIRKAGVLRVATFDSNPPFGSIDPKSYKIVGYDVDIAQAVADALGVRLTLVATNPANRIPLLQSGKVDLIVADITITPERAKVVDFSTPYFITGQQFLVSATSPDDLAGYAKSRVGAVEGHHRRAAGENPLPRGPRPLL